MISKQAVLEIITSYLGEGIDGPTLVSMTKSINSLSVISDGWISVSEVTPKEDVWYQCAKYLRREDRFGVMLMAHQYYEAKNAFMPYGESHFDNAITHYRELPPAPTK
jgi:hypothetical protein